jgi:hypothetical protein
MRGKRTHQPDPKVPPTLTDGHYKDGKPWETIFTEDEHLDLIYRIDKAGETYRDSPKRVGNAHLLTGLAICGICAHRLGYGRVKKGDKVYARYACKRDPGSLACGGVSIAEDPLDRYVMDMVREFGHLYIKQAEQKRRNLETAIADDGRDLATNEHTLADLTRDRYAPDSPLTDDLYAELRVPLVTRIAELQDKLSRPQAEIERLQPPFSSRGFTAKFGKGVDGRAYLRTVLSAVEINPAKHRGGRFDRTRVKLHWRSGDVTTDTDMRSDEAADDDADIEAWNAMVRGKFD